MRSKFQAERPTLANLAASGEYTEPLPQSTYLSLMEFAAGVRQARLERSLSLTDIAAATGIDKAALSRLENGQAENPTYHTLERIASALGKRLQIALVDEA